MLVQFDYTKDDLFDVSMRSIERLKTVNFFQWKNIIYNGLFAAILDFALIYWLSQSFATGMMIGLLAGVISGAITPYFYRARVEKRI